jgi:hypothetical protein
MTLQQIGRQLDRNIFPCVTDGGIVVPNTAPLPSLTLGEEKKNENQRKRRSESKPWARATRRKRKACRPWQTCHPPSIVSTKLQTKYKNGLNDVSLAYPNTQVWQQADGMWLLTESTLLPEHWHKAIFITAIPYVWPYTVRSWGFWAGGFFNEPAWIGPRHTNFPDGSVCAFEPTDKTWIVGQDIVKLLDLYTLWAVRHLHLIVFGRWPGHQAVFHPCERLLEIRHDELCGCGLSDKLYEECCQAKDLARDRVEDAVDFYFYSGCEERKPPDAILKFVREQKDPPPLFSLLQGN